MVRREIKAKHKTSCRCLRTVIENVIINSVPFYRNVGVTSVDYKRANRKRREENMSKERFEFGKNWGKFLGRSQIQNSIEEAEKSLRNWLDVSTLQGKSFLDIGSGSGLFSLAARNLGAKVHSFDYDEDSVNCTRYLKNKFYQNDMQWQIEQGDVLDKEYLSKLDKYDIVYSWGVLHHTGNMYQALENTDKLVASQGILFISIYNDQRHISKMWRGVKRAYNSSPKVLRVLIVFSCLIRFWGPATVIDILKGKPFFTWRSYIKRRGMSPYRDVVDWVGGYPFEVARPEEIFNFFHKRGYTLEKLFTAGGGHGCNQYVFQKI